MTGMSDRREAIARVAAGVIASEGLERASLRQIAARMDATIGTLTHQFRDRDDLLRTTFEVTVQAIRTRTTRAAHGKRGVELLTSLLSEAIPTDPTRQEETAVWLAFAMSATINADHARLYKGYYREWEDILAEVVATLPGSDGRDPRDVARLLIAVSDGIALRALAGRDLAAIEQQRLLAVAIAAVLHAGTA